MQPSSLRNSMTPSDSPAPGSATLIPSVQMTATDDFTIFSKQREGHAAMSYKNRNDGSHKVDFKFMISSAQSGPCVWTARDHTLSEPSLFGNKDVSDWLKELDGSAELSYRDKQNMRIELMGFWTQRRK